MANDKEGILVDFSAIEKNIPVYTLKTRGIQAIPIDKIIGSLGRYLDFSETLLPKRTDGSSRYEYIKSLMEKGVNLEPIQVYQMLDNYFIIDGHHRVAVAKNEFKAKVYLRYSSPNMNMKKNATAKANESTFKKTFKKLFFFDFSTKYNDKIAPATNTNAIICAANISLVFLLLN